MVEGLLSNAAKFTKNGRITFSASMQDDSCIVTVQDTGVGISEGQMATLFETFGRSEDETASKYGDEVRLGVPLAFRYCELMGGKLSVQSKLGEGFDGHRESAEATAWRRGADTCRNATPVATCLRTAEATHGFPVRGTSTRRTFDALDCPVAVTGDRPMNTDYAVLPRSAAPAASHPPRHQERNSVAGGKGRLLIVDDVLENREILKRRLERHGFHATVAGAGSKRWS